VKFSNATRTIAIGATLVAAVGWFVLAFLSPFAPSGQTLTVVLATYAVSPPQVLALRMIAVQLLAAAVAAVGHPALMFIAFAVAFVPYGLYLLLTPGFFWVGVADLIYFGAAVAAWSERRTRSIDGR
jgi:hypothetical protein